MPFRRLRLATFMAATVAVSACDLPGPVAPTRAANESAAFAKKSSTQLTQSVTGTILNGGAFTGTFTITEFVALNGQLYAVGTLTGTLTDASGASIGTLTDLVLSAPVASISGSCETLHLELGPVDLDLLGIQVHLDNIVFDITAQSGSGKLLCGISNLLNSGGALNSIAQALNQLIALLG